MAFHLRSFIIFTIITCLVELVSANLIMQTSSGPIQGTHTLSDDVEAYLGIPYAEPPVGDLRFAKPVPKKPWTEILNASNLPPPCAQVSFGFQFYFMPDIRNMSEDCLYLNIWSPKSIFNDALRPVIIFLHPGGFMVGTSSFSVYDGSNFAKRSNVVVVTINYRLGPFGYFLAYTEEAAGNMGMLDQVVAIKWVKDNAKLFGGDPGNIVLMGESAGAISVAAHMVSPISRNLFQKSIIQSGSIVNSYFFDNNTRLFENSERVASITGCSNESMTLKTDPKSVVSCLRHQTVESIIEAEKILLNGNVLVFFLRSGDEFLPESAIDLLRKGKFRKDVPILTGFNKDEGTIYLTIGFPEHFGAYGNNISPNMNKHFIFGLSRTLLAVAKVSKPSEILDYYVSTVTNRSSLGYVKMLADILGDYTLSCSSVFQADLLALNGNPVFFYKFGFRAHSTPTAEWIGVPHLDEVQYIFGNPYHENFTYEEIKLIDRLMDRWSAFAKTGDPNIPSHVPWLPYSYLNPLYLSIEQEEESIRMKPLDRCDIWRERWRVVMD